MVQLQLVANAITKSRSQIKPKLVKGSSINTILIFSMAGKCIFIAHSWHFETVCLLSKLNFEYHIEVEVNLDEMDLTVVESKATYGDIKACVKEKVIMVALRYFKII